MSVMEMQKGAENTSNMQAGVDLTQALDKQEEPEEEKADQEDMAANALEEANAQLQATMFRVHAEHTMLQRVLGAVVGGLLIWDYFCKNESDPSAGGRRCSGGHGKQHQSLRA